MCRRRRCWTLFACCPNAPTQQTAAPWFSLRDHARAPGSSSNSRAAAACRVPRSRRRTRPPRPTGRRAAAACGARSRRCNERARTHEVWPHHAPSIGTIGPSRRRPHACMPPAAADTATGRGDGRRSSGASTAAPPIHPCGRRHGAGRCSTVRRATSRNLSAAHGSARETPRASSGRRERRPARRPIRDAKMPWGRRQRQQRDAPASRSSPSCCRASARRASPCTCACHASALSLQAATAEAGPDLAARGRTYDDSHTTATPRGSMLSMMASATCLVRRSCSCNRRL